LSIVCAGLAKAQDGSSIEIPGLLLGAEMQRSLVITQAIPGRQFSAESEIDKDFMAAAAHLSTDEGIRIVGMFQSHPGLGVFGSEQDLRTLATFQRLCPHFVMMIIDPLTTRRFNFFRYDATTKLVRPISVHEI
jgi:proteasome lid subunit RPN8/RPN11